MAITFTVAPPSADIASLDPAEDSSDASKARAIGRKKNGYGKALGDVVLPEGKTVSGLAESALTTGFQPGGIRCREAGRSQLRFRRFCDCTDRRLLGVVSAGVLVCYYQPEIGGEAVR
jgi:hypothetical protein